MNKKQKAVVAIVFVLIGIGLFIIISRHRAKRREEREELESNKRALDSKWKELMELKELAEAEEAANTLTINLDSVKTVADLPSNQRGIFSEFYSSLFEVKKWGEELKPFHLPMGWQIVPLPAHGNVVVRFKVVEKKSGKDVTVMFDPYGVHGDKSESDGHCWLIYGTSAEKGYQESFAPLHDDKALRKAISKIFAPVRQNAKRKASKPVSKKVKERPEKQSADGTRTKEGEEKD